MQIIRINSNEVFSLWYNIFGFFFSSPGKCVKITFRIVGACIDEVLSFLCLPPQTTSYHTGGGMNGIGGTIKAQLPNSIEISRSQEQISLSMQVCPPPPKGPSRPPVVCGASVVRKHHSYLNQLNSPDFRRKYPWVCKYAPPPKENVFFTQIRNFSDFRYLDLAEAS